MTHSESTVKTYLYLRVGVLSLALFLGASLVIEMGFGDTEWLGSISAYYYTPVRSVLVGSLVAMGVCLVAIKGRDTRGEDLMLNLAGMCAPVVALVPTPLEDAACPDGKEMCVPEAFLPGVVNNVEALLVVGTVATLFGARTIRRDPRRRRGDVIAVAASAVALAGLACWFALGRDGFLGYAHYVAAVPMFGLIVAVALVNSTEVERFVDAGGRLTMLEVRQFRAGYRLIAYAMAVVMTVAILFFLVHAVTGSHPFEHWVFVVEALLLLAFSAFWVLQTLQYAKDGAPD